MSILRIHLQYLMSIDRQTLFIMKILHEKSFKKSLKILKLEYWISQNISKKEAQKYKGR